MELNKQDARELAFLLGTELFTRLEEGFGNREGLVTVVKHIQGRKHTDTYDERIRFASLLDLQARLISNISDLSLKKDLTDELDELDDEFGAMA
jgi:hypothetical protein